MAIQCCLYRTTHVQLSLGTRKFLHGKLLFHVVCTDIQYNYEHRIDKANVFRPAERKIERLIA